MKIHVTLLGREVLPIYYPIKQFQPDEVYIIGTRQNRNLAERLIFLLTGRQEENCFPVLKSVKFIETDAFDYNSIMEACHKIHDHNHTLKGEDFMYNVTGGTKIMTLAAFAIAREMGAKIIYTDSSNIKYLSSNPLQESRLDCRLQLREIIALHGQIIKSSLKFNPKTDSKNISASKDICEFIAKNRDIYDSLRETWLGHRTGKDNIPIPNEIPFCHKDRQYKFFCSKKNKSGNRTMTITDSNNISLLSVSSKDPKSLLLKGVWWEILIADALATISPDYAVWRNVEFRPVNDPEGNGVKNEIDILVDIGNKLLFVECKSGKFDSNNIHKIRTVRSTFGGEKSKAVLISAWPQDTKSRKDVIHENAHDSDIPILSPSLKQGFASHIFLTETLPAKMKEIINRLLL